MKISVQLIIVNSSGTKNKKNYPQGSSADNSYEYNITSIFFPEVSLTQ